MVDVNDFLKKMTVLYVEDDPTTRDVMRHMLEGLVAKTIYAEDGVRGWELFLDQTPDMVITDISMPGINGLELSRKIREQSAALPIIITSGHNESELLIEAINSNISYFLLKPLKKEALLKILQSYAQNKIKSEEHSCNSLLLDQYKDVVDESTIVSKTDPAGKIIYANEAFCKISQYSMDEIIGKPHNIVRHPDMDSNVFKEMWETIQNKKTWHGIIKNRAKDGSSYVVDSTVKAIVNRNGEVIEYIAIRHDITQIIQLNHEIEETQKELLYSLGELAETHSMETGNHVKRVASYSKLLAEKYGLPHKEVDLLYHAAPMHDIGKVAVSDEILNKADKLDAQEWAMMQQHAERGFKVFKNSKRALLQAAAIIAHEHHERYDGGGYPLGLKGEKIHIYGRIVAIADVFDALGSDRVYKKAWPLTRISDYFKEERGGHFDPKLVDIFLEHFDAFTEIRNRLQD